jgi:hypothetical protein
MTFSQIPNMSEESRLKKLRGSGGYIMASVTDEQQVKGNLGGPDLFLAPIGRLDSEIITKHFCNTCEKEFEGSPKIEFENPNEEVAENLILAEKGQYICNSCNASIAEYREFKKQDEQEEVGKQQQVHRRKQQEVHRRKQQHSRDQLLQLHQLKENWFTMKMRIKLELQNKLVLTLHNPW